MLRLGIDRDEISVVCDQYGAPTTAADLAAAIALIAYRLVEDPQAPVGTFHFSNAGETTWHGLAEAIFAGAALRGKTSPRIVPITTRPC